jgi:hypothetical protein
LSEIDFVHFLTVDSGSSLIDYRQKAKEEIAMTLPRQEALRLRHSLWMMCALLLMLMQGG